MPRTTSSTAAATFRVAAVYFFWFCSTTLFSAEQANTEQTNTEKSKTVAVEVPREVFLWYVNETSPTAAEQKNYDTIIEWLESGSADKTNKYAEGLRKDLKLFPAVVDHEQAAIQAGTIAADGKLDTMIVTNRLAREGKYLYFDPAAKTFAEGTLALPSSKDYILASNPLVRGEVLALVLSEAARRYDPAIHRFVLITKSHGGPDRALTVRLSRHHEQITREILLAGLDGNPEELPSLMQYGVTKEGYFAALADAGKTHKMQFPLVFMEACRATISAGTEQTLPTNVDLVYTNSNRALQYSTLDYDALLKQVAAGETLAASLDQFLKPRYMAFYRPESPLWKKLAWFAPLTLLLAFFAWIKWRQAREPKKVR
jgi:hypothetical protein